jgi:O-antigen/teichoic acid export membrane protein
VSKRSSSIFGALTTGFILKLSGAALNFLAVPIALHLLGEKTYAAFTAILGFASWLALGSSGIGSLTAMNVAGHTDHESKIRNEFWQAVVSNVLGVVAVAVLFVLPFHAFVERLVVSVPMEERGSLRASAYYCFIAIALTVSSVAFEGRYIGLLRSGYCNMVRMAGQVLALVMLVFFVRLFPNAFSFTVALTMGPLAAALWFIVRGSFENPPPEGFRYDLRQGFSLIQQGYAYLICSLATMFYSGGSLPLFTLVFGEHELATAGVVAKIILLYLSLASIFVIPLAAALKQALAVGDYAWVRKTLLTSLLLTMAGSIVLGGFVLFAGLKLIALWTGVGLPGMERWIAPLAIMITVAGWYQFWVYVCFAFEGAMVVALCAIAEVTTITLAYVFLGPHLEAAGSLWIMALVILAFTGSILPIRILHRLRRIKF